MNALNSSDFTQARDPFALFRQWMAEAAKSEVNDPEAMTLASVDESGLPDARIMLCKGADERGFVFYTNAESAKGRELAATPKAAVLFHWKSLRRQVRARGAVARIPDNESDAYFASRPRASRIGAWASQQSRPLEVARQAPTGGRRLGGEIRHRRHSAAALLGRLPADADRDRVLAGRAVPPARSRLVQARARGRALVPRAPVSLSHAGGRQLC